MSISTFGWTVVAVSAWLVVAAVVAIVFGRTIRVREAQVPTNDAAPPVRGDPDPAPATEERPSEPSTARGRQQQG